MRLRRPSLAARAAVDIFVAKTGYRAKAVGRRVHVDLSPEAATYVAGILDDHYNVDTHQP